METRSDPFPSHSSEDDIPALKAYLFRSDVILARALADYECNAPRRQTVKRRRNGVILTVDEVRYDLEDILISLIHHLDLRACDQNSILKTPVQALIYAKHTASTSKDYSHIFEHDIEIKHLRDVLETIYKTASAWCNERDEREYEAAIGFIQETAHNGLKGRQ